MTIERVVNPASLPDQAGLIRSGRPGLRLSGQSKKAFMGDKTLLQSGRLLNAIDQVRRQTLDPTSLRESLVAEARAKLESGALESPGAFERAAEVLLGIVPDDELFLE